MKAMAYNSIIIFKQQGEEQSALMDNLSKDDFLLGIQTEFQRDAMKQFASKVILMDATHCVTQYDFLLISVFVIDDHGSGLPVAWAISTREDTTILVQFLKSIHERTGDLNVNCFMSDCADQYYAAWSSVFGQTKRLLCIWHVDKAWRKALNDHISSTQDRVEIYHQLRILLQETDKSQFTVKLQQLLSYSQNKYIDFYNYFVKNYVPSVEMWATCHRRGTIVNTNMFVEAFHRVLKIIHLNNKQNRRVDSLLHVLLRFARNLIFKQLEQVEKCKITHRKCEINKRHKAVLRNSKGISGWRMESFNDKGNFYILQLVQEECDCPLKCSTCNACIHMYTCTCLDATLHNTVCKHIHLLHMTLLKQDESLLIQDDEDDLDEWNYDEAEDYNYDDNGDGDSDDVTDDEECALDNDDSGDDGDHSASDVNDMTMSTNNAPNDELHEQNNGAPEFNTEEYFTHILNTGCSRDTHEVTNEIETLTGQLLSLVQNCQNVDTLKVVKTHLQSGISLLLATEKCSSQNNESQNSFIPTISPAPNANHKKQVQFYSTKKKRKRKNIRLAKPSKDEEKKAKKKLKKTNIRVCSVCWNEDDCDSELNKDITWISCDSCGVWIHLSCCNSIDETDSENFYCEICLNKA